MLARLGVEDRFAHLADRLARQVRVDARQEDRRDDRSRLDLVRVQGTRGEAREGLLILLNDASLSLKDGMSGTGAAGAAGFHDQVNLHLVRVFGNALLLSVFSAAVQLIQIPSFGQGFAESSSGNVRGAALGQELRQPRPELIRRGMNVAPSLEIRTRLRVQCDDDRGT